MAEENHIPNLPRSWGWPGDYFVANRIYVEVHFSSSGFLPGRPLDLHSASILLPGAWLQWLQSQLGARRREPDLLDGGVRTWPDSAALSTPGAKSNLPGWTPTSALYPKGTHTSRRSKFYFGFLSLKTNRILPVVVKEAGIFFMGIQRDRS